MLHGKHRSKLAKTFFAKPGKIFHRLKVFFVILPLIKMRGIFFSFILNKKFGHISESTKQTTSGFHLFKNLSDKCSASKGKNRCLILFCLLVFFF
jgi:hypothetical protein